MFYADLLFKANLKGDEEILALTHNPKTHSDISGKANNCEFTENFELINLLVCCQKTFL